MHRTGPVRANDATPQPRKIAWRDAVLYASIVCATFIAYWPAIHGALLWDDNAHVTRPELQSLHGLWRIWFDLGATQQYYPLLHSAFWLEHHIWGDAVSGYHALNIVLHAISACLVVAIVRRLALPGAWLAGFLFALHPVCVEAVAWISEQKSALSGVFCLASAFVYLDFDRTRRKSRYFLASGLFVLALMCKTVTVVLPAILVVIFWWQRGRIEWRRDIAPLTPWVALGIPAGLFTALVERTPGLIGAQGSEYALTAIQRVLLAARVPWFYASKAIVPSNLMFVYPKWKIDPSAWWQYLFPIGLALVAAGFIWLAKTRRGPLACLAIFTGALFPALGFFNVYPFRYSYVADHFQYLALLAIVIPAAYALTVLAARAAPKGPGAAALLAIVPLALGYMTWRQSENYAGYETLFRRTLARNPESAFLHSNLGVILMQSGREGEAAAEFQEAVQLAPGLPEYRVNHGLALAQLSGRISEAMTEYREALRLDPHYAAAHLNLGLALTSQPGRLEEAIGEYRQAIAEYRAVARGEPDQWEAHFNLGLAYGQTPGREGDAIDELQTALRMKPDSALVHFHLGNAFHKLGRLQEAIAEYRESARLDPDVPEVHYELAYALAQIPGQVAAAIAECRKMLSLKPADEPGQQLMASLVAFQNGSRH
jgi:protein O-mannosyl-transferase